MSEIEYSFSNFSFGSPEFKDNTSTQPEQFNSDTHIENINTQLKFLNNHFLLMKELISDKEETINHKDLSKELTNCSTGSNIVLIKELENEKYLHFLTI
jgi:hypothetical protein